MIRSARELAHTSVSTLQHGLRKSLPKDQKPPRPGAGGGDPNFNWRSLIIIAIFFGLVAAYWIVRNGPNANSEKLNYDQFLTALSNGQIYKDDTHPLELLYEDGSGTQMISGYYSKPLPAHADTAKQFHTTVQLDFSKDLEKRIEDAHLEITEVRNKSNMLATTLLGFLPIVFFLLILYFLFRQQIRMAGKSALQLRQEQGAHDDTRQATR